MDTDQTIQHPPVSMANAEIMPASHLFMAVVPALNSGNIYDAGFLFYIAKFRAQLEIDAFPPSEQGGDSPSVAFAALSEQMGSTINPMVASNPEAFKTILDRVAQWHPKIDENFQPDWNYTHKADLAGAYANNDTAVAVFLKGMGGFCTLLNDPEYFRQYQVVLRYNTMTELRPTEQEFKTAIASLTAEEKRRNIQGLFYKPEQ